MKSFFKKMLIACCVCIGTTAMAQRELSADQIKNDPDWQIIIDNNADFLNRVLVQGSTIAALWSQGPAYFLESLNYTREEYERRHAEVKEAANRLLRRFAPFRAVECETCGIGEAGMIEQADKLVTQMRVGRIPEPASLFREIDSIDGDGPKCGFRFYMCVLTCASTIEFFPLYLLCCGGCLCQFCKNPPSWC